jgi:transcriptional regulator with XRE-family HTH domain
MAKTDSTIWGMTKVKQKKMDGLSFDFGRRLKEARLKKGITQAELAQRMGLTLRAITYYEGESTNPSLQFIEKAAKALGITQGALLGTEWKEQPLAAANQDKGVIKTLKLRLPKLGLLPRKDQESLVAVIDGLLAKGAG